MALCRHVGKAQTCFPSKRRIADKLGISERSVYTAIKDIEKWNIIRIQSQGRKEDDSFRSLTYYLMDKSQWNASHRQIVPIVMNSPDHNEIPYQQEHLAPPSDKGHNKAQRDLDLKRIRQKFTCPAFTFTRQHIGADVKGKE